MQSAWLITRLCNNSKNCASQRLSGVNLNGRNVLMILPKPHSCWRSIDRKKRGKKKMGIIFSHCHADRKSKLDLCHCLGWVLLSLKRGRFENPRHMNAAATWEKKRGKKWRRPVKAAKFYLKADSVVTIDDGFMWSFWGLVWLTGSFPLLNY